MLFSRLFLWRTKNAENSCYSTSALCTGRYPACTNGLSSTHNLHHWHFKSLFCLGEIKQTGYTWIHRIPLFWALQSCQERTKMEWTPQLPTGCKECKHETKSYKVFQELSVKCPALGGTLQWNRSAKPQAVCFQNPGFTQKADSTLTSQHDFQGRISAACPAEDCAANL